MRTILAAAAIIVCMSTPAGAYTASTWGQQVLQQTRNYQGNQSQLEGQRESIRRAQDRRDADRRHEEHMQILRQRNRSNY